MPTQDCLKHSAIYNLTCISRTGKRLKIATQLLNDKKNSDYIDWHMLPENKDHKAWMKEAEGACARWLRKHRKDKSPWEGYAVELLAVHRDNKAEFQPVLAYPCIDSLTEEALNPRRRQKTN